MIPNLTNPLPGGQTPRTCADMTMTMQVGDQMVFTCSLLEGFVILASNQ